MNAWRKATIHALALGAITATALPAERAATDRNASSGQPGSWPGAGLDECNVEKASSNQVKDAFKTITLLQLGSAKPDDAKKRLTKAVSDLTAKPDYGQDQVARDFALGASLVLLYDQLGEPATVKRGDVGYATDKEGNVDLLAAADSAFRAIETRDASCAEKTQSFRERPWAKLVNQIPALLNADHVDSANALLTRSKVIYRDSPYTYYFQGQIEQRKDDWKGSVASYTKLMEMTTPQAIAADSNLAGIREYGVFGAAYGTLRVAQTESGDAQKAEMKKAADLYRQFIKEYPSSPNLPPAQAGLTAALQGAGDTESLASMWKEMIANPSGYSDVQLFDAGTQAFAADQIPIAVQLMELGHKVNPYLRGGLFNLANAYWRAEQFDKMLPITQQLVAVDPNNPDDYQLMAIAYQGLGKEATDPKLKKEYADSVNKYVVMAEKLPVKVTMESMRDGATTKVDAKVENLGSAPKNATLKVEFLDKSGAVVATQQAPVSLQPKETKPVSLSAEGASIVAYRYEAIK